MNSANAAPSLEVGIRMNAFRLGTKLKGFILLRTVCHPSQKNIGRWVFATREQD